MKKFLAIILSICLFAVALPVGVSAEAPQNHTLIKQINQLYQKTLKATGEPNMDNLCGTFVGYQLYFLGITTSAVLANGSEFYSMYARQAVTSGGYNVNCYSAENYTLEQALNAITHNGTKDAYNIILCFDWTKSGGGYGHVMLIHGIVDGVVYGVDNFTTTIAGEEGNPMIAPIDVFADEYSGWSSFEGAVEFGVKEYASLCPGYATDLFVKMTESALLLSQPAPAGSNDSLPVRVVIPGERLAVTDVVVGQDEVNYYKVVELGACFYVPCAVAQPIRFNTEGVQTRNIRFENAQAVGAKGVLSGEIYSIGSLVGRVELVVTDSQGQEVLRREIHKPRFNHGFYDLQPDFSKLEAGTYAVNIYANLWNYYDNAGIVENQNQRICVFADTLFVGQAPAEETAVADTATPDVKHSWLYEDGVWRCYRNGEPRTGWYCYDGVDYYLKEDGSVTTGWANINGEDRFFSDTGAMRTGWLIEDNGDVRYMLFNGVSAKGWREIDGEKYFFDENGILDEKAIG